MNKLKILFFGALSEITGKQEEEITLKGDLQAVLEYLKQKYPALSENPFSIAVNQEISGENKVLSDGDEVALLPPFTGG